MSYAEKYVKVQEWWNIGRFHLAMAFKSPTELNYFLGGSLSLERWIVRARKKRHAVFVDSLLPFPAEHEYKRI